jgi:hypothetical protein
MYVRKKSRLKQTATRHKIPARLFTCEQCLLMLQALIAPELYFAGEAEAITNLDFARDTVSKLKEKISRLGQGTIITFDQNERILIYAALIVFNEGLKFVPASPQKEQWSRDCTILTEYFASVVNARFHI